MFWKKIERNQQSWNMEVYFICHNYAWRWKIESKNVCYHYVEATLNYYLQQRITCENYKCEELTKLMWLAGVTHNWFQLDTQALPLLPLAQDVKYYFERDGVIRFGLIFLWMESWEGWSLRFLGSIRVGDGAVGRCCWWCCCSLGFWRRWCELHSWTCLAFDLVLAFFFEQSLLLFSFDFFVFEFLSVFFFRFPSSSWGFVSFFLEPASDFDSRFFFFWQIFDLFLGDFLFLEIEKCLLLLHLSISLFFFGVLFLFSFQISLLLRD